MSTAGKVLTVLVMLVAVVWVMLTASVTQLNRNGAKAVEDLKKKVAALEVDVNKVEHDFQDEKDRHHQVQLETQADLTGRQVKQSDLEKAKSAVLETLTRVKIQLADAEALVKANQTDSEERLAEKNDEIKKKAEAEASVVRLRTENGRLLARLTSLRDQFRATLRANKALVDRIRKAREQQPGPRRASLAQ